MLPPLPKSPHREVSLCAQVAFLWWQQCRRQEEHTVRIRPLAYRVVVRQPEAETISISGVIEQDEAVEKAA